MSYRSISNTSLTCFEMKDGAIKCENSSIRYVIEEHPLNPRDGIFWVYLGSYVLIVLFAGVMSGLTLAILSLDVTSLDVTIQAGTDKQKKYAKGILPLARRHHWVLVALVIANSLAVEGMPLVLDRIADTFTSMAVSVTAVLFIGEVLPQAICSRYGMAIGYYCSWIVWGLIGLFFLVVWPVSKLLDCMLGDDHGTFYRRAELKALVSLHGPSTKEKRRSFLTDDEVKIISAALGMTSKEARSMVKPLEEVFMVPVDAVFDENTLLEISDAGHSRIPIYRNGDRTDVVGVLLAKKLILVDPKKRIPVRTAIQENFNHAFTKPYIVDERETLQNMLNKFQEGKTHMAFITKKDTQQGSAKIVGIVTLEQLIETLLQEEIWDETDKLRRKKKKMSASPSLIRLESVKNVRKTDRNSIGSSESVKSIGTIADLLSPAEKSGSKTVPTKVSKRHG